MTEQLAEARSVLAAEWASVNPKTPDEIRRFYETSVHIAPDLEAWHSEPERQRWTEAVRYVAQRIEARAVIDIGCGGGHELRALREAGIPELAGVEPNAAMSRTLREDGLAIFDDVAEAPIERADMLICIDVLEHVPDPESFLGAIASRARAGGERPGAVLVETTATSDVETPLHLATNRGWHPGRVLERHGFTLIEQQGRLRIWQRVRERAAMKVSLLLCAYRTVSVPTFSACLALAGITSSNLEHDRELTYRVEPESDAAWRIMTKTGDGLISRARSVIASRWWAETADEVFLMVDDDIVFTPADATKVVLEAMRTRGIVCAAYPVRSGAHLAIRGGGDADGAIDFGPDQPVQEIEYASTGFMAVHRGVLDAMIPTLELCHANTEWCFWPMFAPLTRPMAGQTAYLSEDWSFCARARELGFGVYLDPSIRLGHLAQIEMDVHNMAKVHEATERR